MDVVSISPTDTAFPQSTPVPPAEAAERRELISAAKAVNASDLMGENQLVFTIDPQTHRPVIRVENRDTHEILLQLPPDYVLRLAKELRSGSAVTSSVLSDT